MAELFPKKQTFVDDRDSRGEQFVITRVKLLTTTSDHVNLPTFLDAALLHTARTTSDPTFYATRQNTQISIDGGTVGDEQVIVSRHTGMINYDRGDQIPGNTDK